MFGFQRVGDLAWAAGDIQARGFLIGGTAGRTTLAGEGLQHQDGHSHLLASTIPNCVSYDPAFSYEMAVIIHDGMKRMFEQQEHVFYYITAMNENYSHPPMPEGVQDGILRGMYLLKAAESDFSAPRVQLLGSGTILREVMFAAEILQEDFGVGADVWSVTSFNELRRDGLTIERYNRYHPFEEPKISHVTRCLSEQAGPAIAATDYMKSYADQIRAFLPEGMRYHVLGTDGFGRSDTRRYLRKHFEVSRHHIAVTALKALADEGSVPGERLVEAMNKFNVDPDLPDPARA
jgi:pyruvate dehydrogenase E1 component